MMEQLPHPPPAAAGSGGGAVIEPSAAYSAHHAMGAFGLLTTHPWPFGPWAFQKPSESFGACFSRRSSGHHSEKWGSDTFCG